MKNIAKNQTFIMITVLMFITFTGLSIYGVSNANRLNGLYEVSYKNSIAVGSHTIDLYGNFLGIQSSLQEAVGGQTEEQIRFALNNINEEGLKIQKNFSKIRSVSADKFDKNSNLLNIILEEYQEYEIAKDKAFDMLNKGELIKCKNHINLVLIPKIKAITINLKIFVDAENNEVVKSYVEYGNVTQYIRIQIWVGIALFVLFLIYVIYYMRNRRKERREKDFIEKEEFRITIDTIVDGVLVLDKELNVIKLNKVAEKLTGWESKMAKGSALAHIFDVVDEVDFLSINEEILQRIQSEEVSAKEHSGLLYSGNENRRPITFNNSRIKNIYGRTIGHVLTFRDITDRRKKEKAIDYMTYHDQVTHIHNRTYFEEKKDSMDQASNYPVSVIQGDINGLKFINDAFGHIKGDELLESAASVMKRHCRKSDILCRTGGDEFTILLPNTDNNQANIIIMEIEKEILKMELVGGDSTFIISIALGCATKVHKDESVEDVINRADDYMYKKKLLEKDSLHSSLLKSIKKTLEEKSHETEAHATRLIVLSKELGKVLNLAKDKLYELELLSNLHDIGKIGISNHILNKKGPLTDEEWIEMKKHPEIGYRIAQSTTELGGIAKYILCHHERWDGNGYPRGLKEDEIPLLSRIISVVDSYDAMTDNRVYRKGISKEAALEEIERCAGTQFDPKIARLFIQMVKD